MDQPSALRRFWTWWHGVANDFAHDVYLDKPEWFLPPEKTTRPNPVKPVDRVTDPGYAQVVLGLLVVALVIGTLLSFAIGFVLAFSAAISLYVLMILTFIAMKR